MVQMTQQEAINKMADMMFATNDSNIAQDTPMAATYKV